MPELVTIPISFIEVTFEYERPNLEIWGNRAPITQVLFNALQPWNPNIDDIEPLNNGKLSEQGLIIRLPLKRAAFFFGPTHCRLSRDSVDWTLAAETIEMFRAATSAFAKLSGEAIRKTKTAVGVHVQPQTMPFIELLKPLTPPQVAALEKSPLRTMAIIAKWDNRKVTLDGSGSLANGLFLKFERDFEEAATLEQVADQLWKDEQELFAILGVQEVR
jgi:hypothetical protein